MAKIEPEISSTELNQYLERFLDRNYKQMERALQKQLVINNEQEINEDDIVKCLYKKGFYKVYGFTGNKVIISNFDMSGDFEQVDRKYLLVVKVDEAAMKVLYGD